MIICPVCGNCPRQACFDSVNRHGRHLQQPANTFTISACSECGLLGPEGVIADQAYYQTYYPQGYHGMNSAGGILTRLYEVLARSLLKQKIRLLLRHSRPTGARRKLLDVGCGPGAFLSKLDQTQFEPHGLEPVGEAVAFAQRQGLKVIQGDVLTTPLESQTYDLITLWHVLEHIDRPEIALARLHDALVPGGTVVIATPNTDSRACRVGREHWFHLDTPRHLHLFNEHNLTRLLRNTGFDVVHRTYLPFDYPLDLFWSLRHRPGCWPLLALYPFTKFFDHENLLLVARK